VFPENRKNVSLKIRVNINQEVFMAHKKKAHMKHKEHASKDGHHDKMALKHKMAEHVGKHHKGK
jgi:hypothetical protein